MSSGPALAHSRVTSIRSAPTQSHNTPTAPHTPPRAITSQYGSPASLRADDDIIVLELGSRRVRAGFAGDSAPKTTLTCGPEQQRRVGDFRGWQGDVHRLDKWNDDYEIWRHDLRDFDLGLFQDKLDRLLRDAFAKHLLIDSRPRRMWLVLDSSLPLPLLSSTLDTVFNRFQAPMVSLASSAVMSAIGAGVRSAVVVNIGWAETIVTTVYEYREVENSRSVRAGKLLLDQIHALLQRTLGLLEAEEDKPEAGALPEGSDKVEQLKTAAAKEKDRLSSRDRDVHMVSFEECEEVAHRVMWCRQSASRSSQRQSAQLETVQEQDETEAENTRPPPPRRVVHIPLESILEPRTLEMPVEKLGDVCDDAFFAPSIAPDSYDDHDLPIHILLYRHLLQLPIDVRATCMPRIIFTGGCANILGLQERVLDELTSLIDRRGWEPVSLRGGDRLRNGSKMDRHSIKSQVSDVSIPNSEGTEDSEATSRTAASSEAELDPIEAKILRNRPIAPTLQGQIRAIHSLGPWAGASLLSQLKQSALATIDRDLWAQNGIYGASRVGDVDQKAQQRQSMGAPGMIKGSGGYHANWTLGTWGAL